MSWIIFISEISEISGKDGGATETYQGAVWGAGAVEGSPAGGEWHVQGGSSSLLYSDYDNDDGMFKVVIYVDSNVELFVEQSILTFPYFQAKMPLNLAFDPNYLDVATKKRVTDEVNIGNLQAYVL